MKICGISDIHGNIYNDIPECDILCICGDIIPLNIQRQNDASAKWWNNEFAKRVLELPCKKVILVPGNHDFYLESQYNAGTWTEAKEIMSDITNGKVEMLVDELYEYEGITFYGTPWIEPIEFQEGRWAFEIPAANIDEHLYNKIPKCDILITHDNPNYNNVLSYYSYGKSKFHLFGHWHDGMANKAWGEYNCSILDDMYNLKKDLKIVTINIMSEEEKQKIVDEILLRLQTISNLTQTVEFSKQLSELIQNYSKELRAEIPIEEDEISWNNTDIVDEKELSQTIINSLLN